MLLKQWLHGKNGKTNKTNETSAHKKRKREILDSPVSEKYKYNVEVNIEILPQLWHNTQNKVHSNSMFSMNYLKSLLEAPMNLIEMR